MRETLKILSNSPEMKIRYYKELHGNSLIVDKNKFLLFTGNIDRYLTECSSTDIGIYGENESIVRNINNFYEFLWEKSIETLDKKVPINIILNLSVENKLCISKKHPFSVFTLERILNEARKLKWEYTLEGSKIVIFSRNGKIIPLTIEHSKDYDIDSSSEFTIFTGLINPNFRLEKQQIEEFYINNLQMKLLWEE